MRVEKLGAHLEAYVETLPTINTLRLCNRFGTGPDCHIIKLPIELVKSIEDLIIAPARKETVAKWERQSRCIELKCDKLDDHFSWEEQHKLYHQKMAEPGIASPDCFEGCRFAHTTDDDEAAQIREDLLEYIGDDFLHKHDQTRVDWLEDVGRESDIHINNFVPSDKINLHQKRESFFCQHRSLLHSQFGIDVWSSTIVLKPLERVASKQHEWKLADCRETTVAYLTLPTIGSLMKRWRARGDDYHVATGYSLPVQLGPIPTPASLRRFPRAMGIFGLERERAFAIIKDGSGD